MSGGRERAARELTLTRDFDAPAETVFDAWLDETSVGRWLFATPDGSMRHVRIDPRVGGSFRIAEQRGDALADHVGEYVEIDRPRRLVFTFGMEPAREMTRVTVEIEPRGTRCRLTLRHELDPRWEAMREKARQGWSGILQGLAETIGG